MAQTVKLLAYNAGDLGSIPGSERSSGKGNGNLLQYSCLENPMDRGAWWATVHWVAKIYVCILTIQIKSYEKIIAPQLFRNQT